MLIRVPFPFCKHSETVGDEQMKLYDLQFTIEELNDEEDYRYLVSSLDLPNLIIVNRQL